MSLGGVGVRGDLVVALYEEDYEWYNATVVQDL